MYSSHAAQVWGTCYTSLRSADLHYIAVATRHPGITSILLHGATIHHATNLQQSWSSRSNLNQTDESLHNFAHQLDQWWIPDVNFHANPEATLLLGSAFINQFICMQFHLNQFWWNKYSLGPSKQSAPECSSPAIVIVWGLGETRLIFNVKCCPRLAQLTAHPGLELQTKVHEDYAKFYQDDAYWGLLLVECAY